MIIFYNIISADKQQVEGMVLRGPKFLVPDDLSIARSSIIAAF